MPSKMSRFRMDGSRVGCPDLERMNVENDVKIQNGCMLEMDVKI